MADQRFRILVIATHPVQSEVRQPKTQRQRKHDQANQANQVITNHVARDQVSTQRGSQKKNRRHHLLMRKVITCARSASSARIYRPFDRAFALDIQSEK